MPLITKRVLPDLRAMVAVGAIGEIRKGSYFIIPRARSRKKLLQISDFAREHPRVWVRPAIVGTVKGVRQRTPLRGTPWEVAWATSTIEGLCLRINTYALSADDRADFYIALQLSSGIVPLAANIAFEHTADFSEVWRWHRV